MSNSVYPTLTGLKFGVKKTPQWSTSVKRSASGRTQTASFMTAPIWLFSLSYEFLRSDSVNAELQSLMGFFNNRQGRYDSFLFTDPDDYSVTDQVVATTVTGQTRYRLNHTYGGFTEGIGRYNSTPVVKLDGVTQSSGLYTLDDNGYLTWTSAPTAGQVMTWTGTFYYRVRFTRDQSEFEKFMRDLWENRRVEFESDLK